MVRRFTGFRIERSACLALGIGLLLTAGLTLWTHRFEQEREDAAFRRQAHLAVNTLRQGVEDVMQSLEVVNHAFVTFGPISRTLFGTFTLPLLQRYPEIAAFSYQRIVDHADRASFEARLRNEFPGYRLVERVNGQAVPAAVRPVYRVIDYIEPMSGNESLIGLNIKPPVYPEATWERATDTGLPVATPLPSLRRAAADPDRVLLVMPVYRQGVSLSTIEGRRRAVAGYTAAVMRPGAFFDTVLAPVQAQAVPGFYYSVYAGAAEDERHLAYRNGAPTPAAPADNSWWRYLLHDVAPPFSQAIDVAGTTWYIVLSPHPSGFWDNHLGSLIIACIGLLLSVLGAIRAQGVSARTHRIEQLVAVRTAELRQANEFLRHDITAREQVEQALQESRKLLRQLSAHQADLLEEERKRIAREIHDDLGQNLLALRIDIALLHARTGMLPLLHQKAGDTLAHLDRTMRSVRRIINNLRPTVLDLGLAAAIEWQAKEFSQRSGIACAVKLDREEWALEDAIATALFRSVQESLTNVQRHAQASQVWIAMRQDGDRLVLEIADNGVGFAGERRKNGSFGLLGMEERIKALGGALVIGRSPHGGARLVVSLMIGPASERPSPQTKLATTG